MSVKRECDRCGHITPIDSLNGREFRQVHVQRGPQSSNTSDANATDLCANCVRQLERWLKTSPATEEKAS